MREISAFRVEGFHHGEEVDCNMSMYSLIYVKRKWKTDFAVCHRHESGREEVAALIRFRFLGLCLIAQFIHTLW